MVLLLPSFPLALRPERGFKNANAFGQHPLLAVGVPKHLGRDQRAAIVRTKCLGNPVMEAVRQLQKEDIAPAHYDMKFLKPLDEAILHDVFTRFGKIITVEDGTITGGLGSAVLEFMADHSYSARVHRLGVPDHFIEQGTIAELQAECGFDQAGIIRAVKEMFHLKTTG